MDELSFGSCLSLAALATILLSLLPPPPRRRAPAPRDAPPGAPARPADAAQARRGAHLRRLLPGGGRGGDENQRSRLRQPAAGRDGGRRRLRRQGPHLRPIRGALAADAQGLRGRAAQRQAGAGAWSASGRPSSPADAVVNLSQGLRALANNVIARAVFGGECRQQEAYLRELEVVATLAGGGAARDLRRSHARVESITAGIIQERVAKRSTATTVAGDDVQDEDLLDVLLRLQEEGSLTLPLTTEIIGAVISDIFGAATDTTGTTLEWVMAELIRNPQAMSRATCEIRQKLGQGRLVTITNADLVGGLPYLRMIIKETLRLRPAAPLILRASQENCRIMGYDIPKGSSVFINAFAVARGPKYWDKADEFRPERFESSTPDYRWTDFEFIPFGAGRRQCPGALFATTTMELTLASLLYHFDWALPDGADPKALDMNLNVLDMRSLCAEAPISVFCQPCIASLTMRLM
ncbi:hypothetical protein PVAP13_9NG515900 [Panicum virgatum]|uniref:Uncharacterized protein n=1 Tax=Panicum virgatum TaxID=38727 RepID=A0A8T0MV45_PANVG|nr:hypothetical protein PVAP13_9NG515900 [Panicum virgatum]